MPKSAAKQTGLVKLGRAAEVSAVESDTRVGFGGANRHSRFERMLHGIIRRHVTREEFQTHTESAGEFPSYDEILRDDYEDDWHRNKHAEEEADHASGEEEDDEGYEHKSQYEEEDEGARTFDRLPEDLQLRVVVSFTHMRFASADEVNDVSLRKQYRLMALECHPDRPQGGNAEQFKELEQAKRTLRDFLDGCLR